MEKDDAGALSTKSKWMRRVKKFGLSLGLLVPLLATIILLGLLTQTFVKAQVPVMLPSGKHFYAKEWDRGFLQVKGTWTIENDNIANPLNVSEINCYLASNECVESAAELWNFSGHSLQVVTNTRGIDSWTSETISFHDDGLCGKYTVTINRLSQSVTGIRIPRQGVASDICKSTSAHNIHTSLQDGNHIWQKLEKEAQNRVLPFFWAGVVLLIGVYGFFTFTIWRK